MKWSIGKKIASGFGLGLAIFILVGVLTYDATNELIASSALVARSQRVLTRLENLRSTLNAAETEQRGYLMTGDNRYLAAYTDATGSIPQQLEDLRQLIVDPQQQRRLSELEPLVAAKLTDLQVKIDLRKSKGLEATLPVFLQGKGKELMEAIQKSTAGLEQGANDLLKERSQRDQERAQRTKLTILFGTLLSFALLATVAIVTTRNIAKPVREISDAAQKIAAGDLTVAISTNNRGDEVGILANAFVGMKENLQKVTSDIQEAVNVLASSSAEIVAATSQVSSTAAETASAISQTTSTAEEVKQSTLMSGQKGRYVSEISQKSSQASQAGKRSVDETLQAMNRIREQMGSIAETVVRLSEQSQAISEIIATVNDLSEQSNLLAVNAAIEAAKAGEQGRGFGVVAQEVKSLAEQSKQATTQVRSILNDIQKATSAAVMATEQGSKAVEAGVKQATQAGESVQALAETITASAEAAFQITASQQQVLAGVDQVVLAMESIKQASTQNVAGTQQASTAAHNLNGLGQKLKQLVEHYRV